MSNELRGDECSVGGQESRSIGRKGKSEHAAGASLDKIEILTLSDMIDW